MRDHILCQIMDTTGPITTEQWRDWGRGSQFYNRCSDTEEDDDDYFSCRRDSRVEQHTQLQFSFAEHVHDGVYPSEQEDALSLLRQALDPNPDTRASVEGLMDHDWFEEVREMEFEAAFGKPHSI